MAEDSTTTPSEAAGYSTVCDYRIAVPAPNPTSILGYVVGYIAVCNRGTGIVTENRPADPIPFVSWPVAVGDSDACEDRIGPFAGVEIDSAMRVGVGRLAVDDGCRNDVWVVGVGASDGNGLAEKVDVPVAGAGVGAGDYDNCIAIMGCIDCLLDGCEGCFGG